MGFITKAAFLSTLIAAVAAAGCSTESDVEITFYGYPDNSPPGADIAYDCGRGYTAGGTGTYDDPLTFATAPGEFAQCEIIYLPYLEKYLRFEDTCAECTTDYASGKLHIDIWTGSSTVNGGDAQINCEDDLTPDNTQTVIVNPSTTLSVNSGSLFSSGTCYTSNAYLNVNAASYCSSSSTDTIVASSTTSTTTASTATSTTHTTAISKATSKATSTKPSSKTHNKSFGKSSSKTSSS